MADITLTIPSDQVDRVVSALCRAAGSPTTDLASAKQAIISHIETTVANVERQPAPTPPEPDVDSIVS